MNKRQLRVDNRIVNVVIVIGVVVLLTFLALGVPNKIKSDPSKEDKTTPFSIKFDSLKVIPAFLKELLTKGEPFRAKLNSEPFNGETGGVSGVTLTFKRGVAIIFDETHLEKISQRTYKFSLNEGDVVSVPVGGGNLFFDSMRVK